MQIKMLTGIAGADFSLDHGAVVDADTIGGLEVAKAWIEAGIAVEAPSEEIAAATIDDLRKQLADVTGARDGLQAALTDAEGALAKAQGAADGAREEMLVHKAARVDADNALAKAKAAFAAQISAATDDLAKKLDAASKGLGDLTEKVKELETARDDALAKCDDLQAQVDQSPAKTKKA